VAFAGSKRGNHLLHSACAHGRKRLVCQATPFGAKRFWRHHAVAGEKKSFARGSTEPLSDAADPRLASAGEDRLGYCLDIGVGRRADMLQMNALLLAPGRRLMPARAWLLGRISWFVASSGR
jgi:hypothetical protein